MPQREQNMKTPQEWTAPLGAHPSAVSPSDQLPAWIRMACQGMDGAHHSGHVFLYNISLETLAPNKFQNIWLPCYGESLSPGQENLFHSIHMLIPWHQTRPERMANWLNCRHIEDLLRQLDGAGDLAADDRVQTVMEKTWVSFVAAPEEAETPTEDDPVGQYAIALYLALPITGEPDVGRINNEKRLLDQLGRISGVSHVTADMISATKVVLGAGIAEPFSTRENGYYKYNFLLSFAARDHHDPPDPNKCVIRHHINVMAGLWQGRAPLPATVKSKFGRCSFIQRNHDVFAHREMRFDAFLLWARHALQPRGSAPMRRWVFKTKVNSARMEEDAEESFCANYPAWEAQYNRTSIVHGLLRRQSIDLNKNDLFPGRLYCRSTEICKNLRNQMCQNIEQFLSPNQTPTKGMAMEKKIAEDEAEFSSFFITAAPGAGKTEFIRQITHYLVEKAKARVLLPCTIVPVSHENPSKIASDLSHALTEAKKKKGASLIILDEAHKCMDLASVFANGDYNCFDVKTRKAAPIIAIFLTSKFKGDEKRLRPWLEDSLHCCTDFTRRTRYLGLPVWDAEDELLVLGAKILRDFKLTSFQFQTKALDFLLIDQPYPRDQMLEKVCDLVRDLNGTGPLRLTHFPTGDRHVQEALKRRRERIAGLDPKRSKSTALTDAVFTILRGVA